MRKTSLQALLAITLAAAPFLAQAQVKATAATFSFLEGNWKSEMGSSAFYENWSRTNDGQLQGNGYFLAKADTVMREIIRIEKIGLHWIYIAAIDKQQPTLFTLVEANSIKLVFENKEHDFPQRVVYETKADGTLLAYIEGKRLGKKVREEFPMKRVK